MYAVIFKAVIKELDERYGIMARNLRTKAMEEYGCLAFHSVTENGREVSISYWDSTEQIREWKNDPLHLEAQRLGKSRWYSSCEIEICEVLRKTRADQL